MELEICLVSSIVSDPSFSAMAVSKPLTFVSAELSFPECLSSALGAFEKVSCDMVVLKTVGTTGVSWSMTSFSMLLSDVSLPMTLHRVGRSISARSCSNRSITFVFSEKSNTKHEEWNSHGHVEDAQTHKHK